MPERVYQCTNINCSNYQSYVVVAGRRLGIDFYEWPNIVCVCGMEPAMVYPPPRDREQSAPACPSCGLWQRTAMIASICADPAHDPQRGGS